MGRCKKTFFEPYLKRVTDECCVERMSSCFILKTSKQTYDCHINQRIGNLSEVKEQKNVFLFVIYKMVKHVLNLF
jgi:hypothetical protein